MVIILATKTHLGKVSTDRQFLLEKKLFWDFTLREVIHNFYMVGGNIEECGLLVVVAR